MVGPHALGIIKNIEEVRTLAELGVVFLLFNIGLELSLERLRSMAKMVFGMGSTQVLVTTIAVALVAGHIKITLLLAHMLHIIAIQGRLLDCRGPVLSFWDLV